MKTRSRAFGVLAALFCLALSSCSAPKPPAGRIIAIQGEVFHVDVQGKVLMIKHEDIPGFMPAMTMGYPVMSADEIKGLQPGDKISAELVVTDGFGRLEKIVKVKKTDSGQTPATSPAH